MPIFQA